MKRGYNLENKARIRNLEAQEIDSAYYISKKQYAEAKIFIAQNLSTTDVVPVGDTSTNTTQKETEMTTS